MAVLPDELWRRIVEIGTDTAAAASSAGASASILSYKDLCCLSITCRRLRRISNENTFWCRLLSSDFPPHITSSSSSSAAANDMKSIYKIRYERDKEKKKLAHRRAVLRIESTISEHVRRVEEINDKCIEESERMMKTQAELRNLRMVRQASVALNVWQPEVIRGRQEHLVGQCDVAVDSRIDTLEMELRLCKQQIAGFEKAIVMWRLREMMQRRKLKATSELRHLGKRFSWNMIKRFSWNKIKRFSWKIE